MAYNYYLIDDRERFDMARLRLVIETQCRENYGAHNWDGVGSCPQRWKSKGGNTYVLDFDHSQDNAKDLVKALRPLIEDRNESYQEFILDWSIVDRDETPWESWESPYFITRNFYGNFVAERELPLREGSKESFVMMPKGDRSEYHVSRKEVA
jgi:hypothetical protein